jgi:hypothetical protein
MAKAMTKSQLVARIVDKARIKKETALEILEEIVAIAYQERVHTAGIRKARASEQDGAHGEGTLRPVKRSRFQQNRSLSSGLQKPRRKRSLER